MPQRDSILLSAATRRRRPTPGCHGAEQPRRRTNPAAGFCAVICGHLVIGPSAPPMVENRRGANPTGCAAAGVERYAQSNKSGGRAEPTKGGATKWPAHVEYFETYRPNGTRDPSRLT